MGGRVSFFFPYILTEKSYVRSHVSFPSLTFSLLPYVSTVLLNFSNPNGIEKFW